jgi:HK97 family phage portal protein
MPLMRSGVSRPLAPQAFAETSPQFNESYFMPRTGLALATTVVTYGLMYRVQPHVFTACNKVARSIAKLKSSVYDTTPDNGDTLDRDGPYATLMKSPCLTLPRMRFYEWVSLTIEIYGEAYLLKNRTGGRIRSFIPMHPALTNIERDEHGAIWYGFMGSPDLWFPESEVVPFRTYNPDNTMRGLSRLEPLRQTLMNEDSARRAMRSWWDNMGRPSYVLSTPKKLGRRGRAHLTTAVHSAIGGADNAGGVLLLEDDVTATRMQLDAEEMQYIDSRKLNRQEVFEVYDLAEAGAAIAEQDNKQTYTQSTKDIYKMSLDHRIAFMEDTFDFYVGAEFYGEKEFRFNVTMKDRGDIEIIAPAVVQLINAGVLMPNEARNWLELPMGEAVGNHQFANQSLQRLGQLGEIMTRYTEQGDAPDPKQPDLGKTQPSSPGMSASNNQNPNPNGDLPQRMPALTDKAKQYRENIYAGLGRGRTWDEIAHTLMDRNPMDRKDIQIASLYVVTGASENGNCN